MGYAQAILRRDVRREESSLQKKATKKSLWGSIGRTLGGLGIMAITGGTVNPLTLGLLTGGASFLGGVIGAKAAGGKLTGGKFFKSDREELQKELGAFCTANIVESLKSGVTAGVGQKLSLMKTGKQATPLFSKDFGMDFKGSLVGKGLEKIRIGRELVAKGETSLGTGTRYQRSPIAKEGWSVDTTYGDRMIPRGEFAKGEITSKLGDIDDLWSEPIQESLYGGVDPSPKGKSIWDILRENRVQGFGSGSKRGFQFN
jgi:hypothetical protein